MMLTVGTYNLDGSLLTFNYVEADTTDAAVKLVKRPATGCVSCITCIMDGISSITEYSTIPNCCERSRQIQDYYNSIYCPIVQRLVDFE